MTQEELKKLLPEVIVENLSADKLAKLGEEFERIVESRVDARTQLAVKCAETQFNEEANAKLQKLVVQIDEAHKRAFAETADAICEAYEKKLSAVKRYYNTQVKKDAIKFQKELVENVSNFIDRKIDSLVPTSQIRKAARNVTALETLKSFRQILNVDEATAIDSVRKPVLEAARVITKQTKRNRLLKEKNARLQKKLRQAEAQQYLVESTANLPAEAKNFVRRVLKNANKEYITENLQHVVAQYKKNQESNRNALLESTLARKYSKPATVNNYSRRALVESAQQPVRESVSPERAEINEIINFSKQFPGPIGR